MFAKLLAALIVTLTLANSLLPAISQAAQLQDRALTLSDNQASNTATWRFNMRFTEASDVAAISMQVCTNDPLPENPCTIPTGLDMSNAVLQKQTGNTGFSLSPSSTANQLILQRSGTTVATTLSTYTFGNILNPTVQGSYYVRIQTYDTSYVAGAGNNYGGIAFAISENVRISATVPPYLLFCVGVTIAGLDCENVSGYYVDFGEFTSRQATQGRTQMLASTNARDGYTIRVNGPTLTSGNNVITNLVGSEASRPGTSQFGMNLRANSSPVGGIDVAGVGGGLPTNGYNQINAYRYNTGDVVATSRTPDNARKYTATYIVNVARTQSPGVYVSTLTYIALGSF